MFYRGLFAYWNLFVQFVNKQQTKVMPISDHLVGHATVALVISYFSKGSEAFFNQSMNKSPLSSIFANANNVTATRTGHLVNRNQISRR